jgi:hypothetical protein
MWQSQCKNCSQVRTSLSLDRRLRPALPFSAGEGDFADGVIAFERLRAGGKVVKSFDREAVALIGATGGETRLLEKPET